MRAIDASHEAMSKLQAMNLARDLSEKIRANSNAYTQYQARINAETQTTTAKSCVQKGTTNPCVQAADFAHYDVAQIIKNANGLGMSIKMPNCQVSNNLQSRRCIYVAWEKQNLSMMLLQKMHVPMVEVIYQKRNASLWSFIDAAS
ncbi:hypothetical protein [Acinetobacter sp. YH16032]|uniref:hypothetical protein n=1 Tax=Acinetobacter sp. YH16032 TaxID=2601181 RepID=UPI0015D40F3F|nr:hypothetical protein [Acinetobacter sp. YH16032]